MLIHKVILRVPEDTDEGNVARAITENRIGRGKNRASFYITGITNDEITLCEISGADVDSADALAKFLSRHKISPVSLDFREITVQECADLLHEGYAAGICPELPEAFGPCGFMPFVSLPFAATLTEVQLADGLKRNEALAAAEKYLSRSLKDEIERIYKGGKVPFCGHPVLYSVCTEKKANSQKAAGMLLSALYAAGRLKSKRAVILNLEEMPLPDSFIDDLFHAQTGGSIMVEIPCFGDDEPEKKEKTDLQLKHICSLARTNRNKVLTVFLSAQNQSDKISEIERCMMNVSLCKISVEKQSRKSAERFLRKMAKDAGCKSFAGLFKRLPKGVDSFSRVELILYFTAWYDEFLKTKAYPEYAGFCKKSKRAGDAPVAQTDAFDELSGLVGLVQAKTILAQARDFAKAQKIYMKRGFATKMPCLHMAFLGNPGTAKTTVARLTARIFKECGVLKKGDIVEVSRSDLVGKYVGWTAKAVSKKFKEAEGGVLFIDEAYSLLDGKEGMFGDEAINQITLEMENHRDDVVVIFAGYKEPMEAFIERNAGLRSRIAFKVDFPDYTEDEMLEIVRLNLEQNKRKITKECEEKVRLLIRNDMKDARYGNGRYARELVERAMLSQASRIVKIPEDQITDEGICYLTEADFPEPKEDVGSEKHHIGFACA